jgi:hypothetical protein
MPSSQWPRSQSIGEHQTPHTGVLCLPGPCCCCMPGNLLFLCCIPTSRAVSWRCQSLVVQPCSSLSCLVPAPPALPVPAALMPPCGKLCTPPSRQWRLTQQ